MSFLAHLQFKAFLPSLNKQPPGANRQQLILRKHRSHRYSPEVCCTRFRKNSFSLVAFFRISISAFVLWYDDLARMTRTINKTCSGVSCSKRICPFSNSSMRVCASFSSFSSILKLPIRLLFIKLFGIRKHIMQFPKFEKQFASLSLINSPEQPQKPCITKGMFSQLKPKGDFNSKICKSQLGEVMQCKQKCLSQFRSIELDLDAFKLYPCTMKEMNHNHHQCPYFHNCHDHRRPGGFYSRELCSFVRQGKNCPYGYNCCHAHNLVEQYYQPEIYRKQLCPNSRNCSYGHFCAFAHTQEECKTLLVENFERDVDFYIFHYKVVECPYQLIKHDDASCLYYHDESDRRRCPHRIGYGVEQCQLVQNNGCQNEQCQFSHNNYEAYFHPYFYKTQQCATKGCTTENCPYFHNKDEIRFLSPLVKSGIFREVPKNRSLDYKYKKLELPKISK